MDDGKIFNSKNVKFLDFLSKDSKRVDYGNLTVEPKPKSREPAILNPVKDDESSEEEIVVKEEDELDDGDTEHLSANDDSSPKDLDVAESLVPAASNPVGCILRNRTLQVKPVKYSHFSEDPRTFKQAIASYNSSGWINAINNELDNIKKHHVWIDQHKEPAKYLNSTWGFKTKPATASSPEKQKARLCIQGFMQTYGKDFFEIFAPTGKFHSLLALLVLAIDLQLPVCQFDVKSTFLFAPLDEEIYIKTPKGSKRTVPFLKLVESLYGLKQALKNWFETLTAWFEEIYYCPSVLDACLFIHKDKNLFIFFHVDDLIVVGQIDKFEKLFLARFPNSSAHSPDTLLGMNLNITPESIYLSQPGLIKKGLEMLGMSTCKSVKTLLTPAVQLFTATEQDHQEFLKLNINY